MSSYFFQNGDVYVSTRQGQAQRFSFDEFMASSMRTDKQAHVLVLAPEGPALYERVRAIRRMFPAGGIKTFVSYDVALRAFLQTQALVPDGSNIVVVDDLGDKFFMTAFKGARAVMTRVIAVQDSEKIIDEIHRTQKNASEKGKDPQRPEMFRVLSNNAAVCSAVDASGEGPAIPFEILFPAFEVLGKVKFQAQLMPPEDIAAARKRSLRHGLILACAASTFIAATGFGFLIYARAQETGFDQKIALLQDEKAALEDGLRHLNGLASQSRLKGYPSVRFALICDEFFSDLPLGGQVSSIVMARGADMAWELEGLVLFPRQEVFPFKAHELRREFSKVEVRDVFIQGKPGVKISAVLEGEKKGQEAR